MSRKTSAQNSVANSLTLKRGRNFSQSSSKKNTESGHRKFAKSYGAEPDQKVKTNTILAKLNAKNKSDFKENDGRSSSDAFGGKGSLSFHTALSHFYNY